MAKPNDNNLLPDLNPKDIIEKITNYADSHLKEIRLSIGALGLIGAGIALRSIRFATKFRDVNAIPKSFVKKNMRLRGIVKSVSSDGTINVDHIPIISMPWHRNSINDKLLNISLSAISPTISGTYWLKLNVENKTVWFQILWRNQNDISCIVSHQKSILFKNNLNSDLVKRGLASVQPFDLRFKSIDSYKKLYKNLIAFEKKAQKDRAGIWFRPSKWDLFQDKFQSYFERMRNISQVFRI